MCIKDDCNRFQSILEIEVHCLSHTQDPYGIPAHSIVLCSHTHFFFIHLITKKKQRSVFEIKSNKMIITREKKAATS